MTKQIEVDPLLTASAFFAAKDISIELSSGIKVVNGKRKMEWRNGHRKLGTLNM